MQLTGKLKFIKICLFFVVEKRRGSCSGSGKKYDSDPTQRIAESGTQFPIAYFEQFLKQGVPRWTSNDPVTQEAYDRYVQKACPCVIVVHSQGGNFAYNAALRYPDRVKAIVMVETRGSPDPDKADFSALRHTPILWVWVWGDFTQGSVLWEAVVQRQEKVRQVLNRSGGRGDLLMLPASGIHGNSHMMMDRNSDQVAGLINNWLIKQKLISK